MAPLPLRGVENPRNHRPHELLLASATIASRNHDHPRVQLDGDHDPQQISTERFGPSME
jgi:hypothetical protein